MGIFEYAFFQNALLGCLLASVLCGIVGTYIVTRPTCDTCNGEDTRCEQECMMEAATREVEYYDDEELDRFKGRPSDCFTDDEAELFREVLMSMPQSDAKGWNRSLILRGINVPDQIKDELLLMIDGDF